jgi:hypothetical protein
MTPENAYGMAQFAVQAQKQISNRLDRADVPSK